MILNKKLELHSNFGNYESGTYGGSITVDSSEFPDKTPEQIAEWMQEFLDEMLAGDLKQAEDVTGLDTNASFISHWNSPAPTPTEKEA